MKSGSRLHYCNFCKKNNLPPGPNASGALLFGVGSAIPYARRILREGGSVVNGGSEYWLLGPAGAGSYRETKWAAGFGCFGRKNYRVNFERSSVQRITSRDLVSRFLIGAAAWRPLAEGLFRGRFVDKLGQKNIFPGRNTFLLGHNTFILGRKNIFLGKKLFVLGQKNIFLGRNVFKMGQKNNFLGKKIIFFGRNNFILGRKNIFLGKKNIFFGEFEVRAGAKFCVQRNFWEPQMNTNEHR